MQRAQAKKAINAALLTLLAANFAFWLGTSDIYARWEGVPPVPSTDGALMMTLGDSEFSYRFGAITLQNLGDYGGQVTPLKDYNYKRLGEWFWLLNNLDPASDDVPLLAAYYFGGTRTPSDVRIVVDYLSRIGYNPVGDKWRWLVQAIFLARHRLDDLNLALDLAYKLQKMEPIGDVLPEWARQMPAFVLQKQGDKAAARKIVEDLLLSSRHFHPNEVNFMKAYLVEQLGVPAAEVDAILKKRDPNLDAGPYQSPKPPPMPE